MTNSYFLLLCQTTRIVIGYLFTLVEAGFTTVKNLTHCILSDYGADKDTDLIFVNPCLTPVLASEC